MNTVRTLLLADTHIGHGFSHYNRGFVIVAVAVYHYSLLNNFRLALQPALHGEVDLVVHGVDLFDRSRVPDALVQIALEPLLEVAASAFRFPRPWQP